MTSDTGTRAGAAERLRRDAEALCHDIGERTLATGLDRAETWIHAALASLALPTEAQRYAAHGRSVANLVARAGGEGPPALVVGAHYDTVPGTQGADDNASAVCVLLELARALAARTPPAPVEVVAFTLEEAPAFGTALQGSRAWIAHRRRRGAGPLPAIVLEMVGFTAERQAYPGPLRWAGYPQTGDFIGVVGNRRSRRLLRGTAAGLRRNPDLPVETLTVPFDGRILPATRLSDHSAFWDAGWPAVMVTDTAFFRNPYYHTPADRPETLDFTFMAEVAAGLEAAVRDLAAGPARR